MVWDFKAPPDDLGYSFKGPYRSWEAGGLRTCHQNLDQLALLLCIQSRFATGSSRRAQSLFASVEPLAVPAQYRLPAYTGAAGHFCLRKTLFQQSERPEAPLFHSFEVALFCHAKIITKQSFLVTILVSPQ